LTFGYKSRCQQPGSEKGKKEGKKKKRKNKLCNERGMSSAPGGGRLGAGARHCERQLGETDGWMGLGEVAVAQRGQRMDGTMLLCQESQWDDR